MECTRCKTLVHESANYCYQCGQPLAIARDFGLQINQEVEKNEGRVIGIETKILKGDVYANGDFYHIQVFALGNGKRKINQFAFFQTDSPPYPFLKPFTAQQLHLYKGRASETRSAVRRISEQPTLTVYGKYGVGKTSLLTAGVIPELTESGALVVYVCDYRQSLAKTIRSGLLNTPNLSITLPDVDDRAADDLVSFLKRIQVQIRGTLIVVLDEFEQVLEDKFPADQRRRMLESLAKGFDEVAPLFFRAIFVIDQDFSGQMSSLEPYIPGVMHACLPVLPLDYTQAKEAILDPLNPFGKSLDRYCYPVSYYPESFVMERLVPELDEVSRETPGRIYPPHLQIVCDQLYRSASAKPMPHLIDENLYRKELGSADTILARYLYQRLDQIPGQKRQAVNHCLQEMIKPASKHWFNAVEFPTNGASSRQIVDAMDLLVEQGFLVKRFDEGLPRYAFTSQKVVHELRFQLSGKRGSDELKAGDELEYLYESWLVNRELPTAEQINRLQPMILPLEHHVTRALFMLRAVLALDQQVDPWMEWLRQSIQVQDLLEQVEFPAEKAPGSPAQDQAQTSDNLQLMHVDKAQILFNLETVQVPTEARKPDSAYGPLSCVAVEHKQATARWTAALALSLLPHQQGIDRLDNALEARLKGLKRWLRKIELYGLLSEHLPGFKTRLGKRSFLRAGVWGWGVWRRILRDRHRIVGLTLGGALGAGLGIGLLRGIESWLSSKPVEGLMFLLHSYWGIWLGGMFSLGLLLGSHLVEKPPVQLEQVQPAQRLRIHPDRLPTISSALLGALFFGVTHMGLSLLGYKEVWKEKALVIPLGFLAGLGLGWGLWGEPTAENKVKYGTRLLRLARATLVFLLVQAIFLFAQDKGVGLFLSQGPGWFADNYSYHVGGWWKEIITQVPGWYNILALVDTSLVGLILTAGIEIGMTMARCWMDAWRKYMANLTDQKGAPS
jgi:hypothetical protein